MFAYKVLLMMGKPKSLSRPASPETSFLVRDVYDDEPFKTKIIGLRAEIKVPSMGATNDFSTKW